MIAVGIDGWRGGWVAVALGGPNGNVVLGGRSFTSFADAVAGWPDATIGVDMPIGYAVGRERRACDTAARAFVAARRSSVFFVPPAAVLDAPTYDAANVLARSLGVPGISRQLWALRTKIAEVAAVAGHGRDRIYEVFPEASFCAMAGRPLATSKRTWHGYEDRRALLESYGIVLTADDVDAAGAAPDDVLDAAAVAWSVARIARGDGVCLPTGAGPGEPTIWY